MNNFIYNTKAANNAVHVSSEQDFENALGRLQGNGGVDTELNIQLDSDINLTKQSYAIPSGTRVSISGYKLNNSLIKPGGYIITKTIPSWGGLFAVYGTLNLNDIILDGNNIKDCRFDDRNDPNIPFSPLPNDTGGVHGGELAYVYSGGVLNVGHGSVFTNNEGCRNANDYQWRTGSIFCVFNGTVNIDSGTTAPTSINDPSTIVFTHNDTTADGGAITVQGDVNYTDENGVDYFTDRDEDKKNIPLISIHGLVNFYQNTGSHGGAICINGQGPTPPQKLRDSLDKIDVMTVNIGNNPKDKILFKDNSATGPGDMASKSGSGGAISVLAALNLNIGNNTSNALKNSIDIDDNNSNVVSVGNDATLRTKGSEYPNKYKYALNYGVTDGSHMGGAISFLNPLKGSFNIKGTIFDNNGCDNGNGGAIYKEGSDINKDMIESGKNIDIDYATSANLDLDNCLFRNNTTFGSIHNDWSAEPYGGAILDQNSYLNMGDMTVNNCQFLGNQAKLNPNVGSGAASRGGAIAFMSFSPSPTRYPTFTIKGNRTIFAGNMAQAGSAVAVVGIKTNAYIGTNSSDKISFDHNVAEDGRIYDGYRFNSAALYYEYLESMNVDHSFFTNNSAPGLLGLGAAVGDYFGSQYTPVKIENSKFVIMDPQYKNYTYKDYLNHDQTVTDGGNTAGAFGGSVWSSGRADPSTLLYIIDNCDFKNNVAGDPNTNTKGTGGAIMLYNNQKSTISNCNFDGNYIIGNNTETNNYWPFNLLVKSGNGGAITSYNSSSGQSIDISSSTFNKNKSVNSGGAVSYEVSSNDNIINNITGSTFINNSATNNGGAILTNFNEKNSLNISDSSLSKNSATNGGAIYSNNLKISGNTSIESNTANNYGGGVSLYPQTDNSNVFTMDQTVNVNNNNAKYGGGIFMNSLYNANLNGTISGNTANNDGGGVYLDSVKDATISATIKNNVSNSGNGGGIYLKSDQSELNSDSQLKITGSTIDSNQSKIGNGGGLYYETPSTQNNTSYKTIAQINGTPFTNNSADNGGAIWIDRSNLGNLSIDSSSAFSNNKANTDATVVNLQDIDIYKNNIKNTSWSQRPHQPHPYQAPGYNNYDISYQSPSGRTTLRAIPNFDFGINKLNLNNKYPLLDSTDAIPDPNNNSLGIDIDYANDPGNSSVDTFLKNRRALIITDSGQELSNTWDVEAQLSDFKDDNDNKLEYLLTDPPLLIFNKDKQSVIGINDINGTNSKSQFTYGGTPSVNSVSLAPNSGTKNIINSGSGINSAVGSWGLDFSNRDSMSLYFPQSTLKQTSQPSGTFHSTVTWTIISNTPK